MNNFQSRIYGVGGFCRSRHIEQMSYWQRKDTIILKNHLFFKLLEGSVVILFDNLLVRTVVGQVRMEAGNDACSYPAIVQKIWQ